ncbi:telomerase reverse transcriptase-like isoform X2 [Sycon ciliatum]|uniref:telomerase reverse transcriptase-like isoform X2 n=1 Tax=Sycon ciliatum TaxID=27933 RepID=UPI0031F702F8
MAEKNKNKKKNNKAIQVITSVFSEPQLLLDYILSLGISQSSVCRAEPAVSALLETLLTTCLVCPPTSPIASPVCTSTPCFNVAFSSQHEVLANAIKVICQHSNPSQNVLSCGYRLSYGKVDNGTVTGTTALENVYPNTTCNHLKSAAWQALLKNIGDDLMTHLLTKCAMFLPLPSSCYLQISGRLAHVQARQSPWLIPQADTSHSDLSLSGASGGCMISCANGTGSITSSGSSGTGVTSDTSNIIPPSRPTLPAPEGTQPVCGSGQTVSISSHCNSSSRSTSASVSLPWWISSSGSAVVQSTATATSTATSTTGEETDTYASSSMEHSVYMLAPPVYGEAARQWRFHRNRMLYATNLQETLPPKFILYQLPASQRGTEILLRLIFDGRKPCISALLKRKTTSRLPVHLYKLMPVFRRLLQNFKKVKLSCLLRKLCPLPESTGQVNQDQSGGHQGAGDEALLSQFTPPHQVVRFLHAVLKKAVPRHLWGSPDNFNVFMKHVDEFVHLHRLDTFSVHQFLSGFKASHCAWLYPPGTGSHGGGGSGSGGSSSGVGGGGGSSGGRSKASSQLSARRQALLQTWLYWLVDNVIINILKTCFYITDTSCHRNKLFFFRKSLWRQVHRRARDKLGKEFMQPIGHDQACSLLRAHTAVGISMIRLVPKSGGGIRPIVNLAYKPSPGFLRHLSGEQQQPIVSSSVNSRLTAAFNILRFEQDEHTDLFGASVYCVEDIYKNWQSFVAQRRAENDTRPLYFVAMDIKGCFDNINQDLLLRIVGELLSNDGYFVRRFSAVVAGLDNMAHSSFKRCACSDEEFGSSFKSFAERYLNRSKLHNAVLTDQVVYPRSEREKLLITIENHIKNNLLRVGYSVCRQCCGVSQGSVLSSLLCCLYYGYLERDLLPAIKRSSGLLQRFVDDYFLVTPCRKTAESVVLKMYNGWPEHGSVVNWKKTRLNFDMKMNMQPGDPTSVELLPQTDERLFPWCGLVFDMVSLNVSVDYSRWFGQYLSDSLTVDHAGRTFVSAKSSMLMTLKTKCNAILLDRSLNSEQTVVKNVYQAFLFVAMKFHALSRRLPQGHRLRHSMNLMQGLLADLIAEFFKHASRQLRPMVAGVQGGLPIHYKQVDSIAHRAFHHVLQRHHSAYSSQFIHRCRHRAITCQEHVKPEWTEEIEMILL